ncbi:hypothetical protein FA13DRAFT_1463504 [Coprinellus micaceus]|uniref:Uncharacterized protein n=1 Tax=Coprinellus micaceus TaxID=71717 RepID=A0A4Y7SMA7_COPMI|nr:hypothetical protein FA13DRAFT_1463504 [Coprinellus micaceus]
MSNDPIPSSHGFDLTGQPPPVCLAKKAPPMLTDVGIVVVLPPHGPVRFPMWRVVRSRWVSVRRTRLSLAQGPRLKVM